VVDNGGLGSNGDLVGPADQHSKIGTFNVAPTFVHLIGTEAVFTIGAFVRQDQYHYYRARILLRILPPISRARASAKFAG